MSKYTDTDALKELIDGGYDLDFDEVPETKRELLRMIDEQSTTDVQEVKHGKWEERKVVENKKIIEEWQSAKCSVCGKYHTTPYLYYFDDFNYCPNCGAKMESKK